MQEKEWSQTVIIPKTNFPMKANLPIKEPSILKFWEENQIYNNILNSRKTSEHTNKNKNFTLHDGPPYANGHFHVGHALNKILKDIINKYHIIQGFKVEYVPGWDCHGLPIELATLKVEQKKKHKQKLTKSEIRQKCREYAKEHILLQAQDQSRMGVFWDASHLKETLNTNKEHSSFYYTMSHKFELNIIKVFYDLFKQDLLYKDKKPIHWCPHCATALAEAEVEYAQHHSPSIYVKFPVKNQDNTYVIIWTTTPWTLPANLAVCFNEDLDYNTYTTNQGHFILAKGRESDFFNKVKIPYSNKSKVLMEDIQKLKVVHPFLNQSSKVIFGDHVTLEAGTGIVHTAPGHGQDDYQVGLKYNLNPYSPVNAFGKYTSDFSELEGQFVFKANSEIIHMLENKKTLVYSEEVEHSYPHCWRCHKPIIFRATDQWFLAINKIKANALKHVKTVKWIPDWGENRFYKMIENRPDWCLSRQRAWGVPIPAFKCNQCFETLMDNQTLEYIIELIKQDGIEIWFNKTAQELLPPNTSCKKCQHNEFTQENDILDVWFDSGITWEAVLKQNPSLDFPADIYLEGSDQHRGWFQSSFWPSIALNHEPPYKKVITHGYVLDEKGYAMSKSLGNVINPGKDIIPKYGADVLRLWVCSEDFRTDNTIGHENLKRISDTYRKIRNTFRYLLGNLNDLENFTPNQDAIYHELDLWILHELSVLETHLIEAYEEHDIYIIFQKVQQFITLSLSHKYFDIIRDALYCNHIECKHRQSHLQTLYILLKSLCTWLAPILSFTMEEIYQLITKEDKKSIFHEIWLSVQQFKNEPVALKFDSIWALKDKINVSIEKLRNKGNIKTSMQVVVKIPKKELNNIHCTLEEFCNILIVSYIEETNSNSIEVAISPLSKCPRCWQHKKIAKTLCERCEHVVGI